MIRLTLILVLLFLAAPVQAQNGPVPIIETQLDHTEVVPGQSVTLRLNILVPTWMPKPPELPSFEATNLRVRRPANGSTAISRRVDGTTWSGISRRYLLTPMVPGRFELRQQTIPLTYIGEDGTTPIKINAMTDPISLTGILPQGTENLDPFIAAEALELTQELSGPSTKLAPGASMIRSVTARIKGASPIVLPSLLPAVKIPAVRVYPDTPQVAEKDDGKTLSGTRIERETFMALGGGTGQVPAIRLDWFNLSTGKVESAEVPGFEISVTGPPVQSKEKMQVPNWRLLLLLAVTGLAMLLLVSRLLPRLRRAIKDQRAAHLASESHARIMLLRAISQRDYPATTHWLGEWRARLTFPEPAAITGLMAQVGATIYRNGAVAHAPAIWDALSQAISTAGQGNVGDAVNLPALNPCGRGLSLSQSRGAILHDMH